MDFEVFSKLEINFRNINKYNWKVEKKLENRG